MGATTQPKAWETLTKNHGAKTGETLLTRLRGQLDQRGTLDVLRHGIENVSWKGMLKLAEFKPALAINTDILARYAANRLRVARQLLYLLHNESSLDRKELEQMNPLGNLLWIKRRDHQSVPRITARFQIFSFTDIN